MISKRAKGTQFQSWVETWIKKNNPDCAVHNFKPNVKKIRVKDKLTGKMKDIFISQSQDLWNCIDLAVYLKHCSKPLFIQATSHTAVDKRLQEMSHVPWNFDHVIVQLWQKKEPGRVVVQQLRNTKRIDRLEPHNRLSPVVSYTIGGLEFYKIGEIKRGKYIPEIKGRDICNVQTI